jgi:hypothetical protein
LGFVIKLLLVFYYLFLLSQEKNEKKNPPNNQVILLSYVLRERKNEKFILNIHERNHPKKSPFNYTTSNLFLFETVKKGNKQTKQNEQIVIG